MSIQISTANLHVILQTLKYSTTSSVSFSGEHLWRYEQKNIAELNCYTNSVFRSAASIWTLLMLLDNIKCSHLHHEITTWRQAIRVLMHLYSIVNSKTTKNWFMIIYISIEWSREVGSLFHRSQCLVKSNNQHPTSQLGSRRLTVVNTTMRKVSRWQNYK